jgi:hypothetical protein
MPTRSKHVLVSRDLHIRPVLFFSPQSGFASFEFLYQMQLVRNTRGGPVSRYFLPEPADPFTLEMTPNGTHQTLVAGTLSNF